MREPHECEDSEMDPGGESRLDAVARRCAEMTAREIIQEHRRRTGGDEGYPDSAASGQRDPGSSARVQEVARRRAEATMGPGVSRKEARWKEPVPPRGDPRFAPPPPPEYMRRERSPNRPPSPASLAERAAEAARGQDAVSGQSPQASQKRGRAVLTSARACIQKRWRPGGKAGRVPSEQERPTEGSRSSGSIGCGAAGSTAADEAETAPRRSPALRDSASSVIEPPPGVWYDEPPADPATHVAQLKAKVKSLRAKHGRRATPPPPVFARREQSPPRPPSPATVRRSAAIAAEAGIRFVPPPPPRGGEGQSVAPRYAEMLAVDPTTECRVRSRTTSSSNFSDAASSLAAPMVDDGSAEAAKAIRERGPKKPPVAQPGAKQ